MSEQYRLTDAGAGIVRERLLDLSRRLAVIADTLTAEAAAEGGREAGRALEELVPLVHVMLGLRVAPAPSDRPER